MADVKVWLKSIPGDDGLASGEYECSECGERFVRSPEEPSAHSEQFAVHVGKRHPDLLPKILKRKPRP
jgi:hypothetical protein